jgi:hypothetical protein
MDAGHQAGWAELAKRVLFVTGTDSRLDDVRARAPKTLVVKKPFAVRKLERLIAKLLR